MIVNVVLIIGDDETFDNELTTGIMVASKVKFAWGISWVAVPTVTVEFIACNNLAPPTEQVVVAFGIWNTINSFVTYIMLVTLLPHNDNWIELLSLIGNPIPTILPYVPPFIPATAGVTLVIVNGIFITETEVVSA